MRILYDTNILVAVFARREATLRFKQEITQRGIEHVSSPHILREVEAVLVERMKLTKRKAKAAARLLERQSIIVETTSVERVCRDPFDDYILAAALAGKVEYIVTADKDLLVLKTYKGIAIIKPSDFAEVIRRG